MLHFLAKIGRSPYSKLFVPVTTTTSIGGYFLYHSFGHDFVCKYLGAQSDVPGRRQELTEELQKLIKTVYADLRDTFAVPAMKDGFMGYDTSAVTMRWFATSTMEPVNVGMSEFKTGISIGIPSYYNYKEVSEIPESMFAVTQINFFKRWSQKNSDTPKQEEINDLPDEQERQNVSRIQKDTPSGKDYIESLLLSDEAKKFSIARELYMTDSYRITAIAVSILLSAFIPLNLSRLSIIRSKLHDAHLSQRIPIHCFAILSGVMLFNYLSDTVNTYFCRKADFRAIMLNESYRRGAEEYFKKIIQRHKALREQIAGMDKIYDSDGNFIEPAFRRRHVPYTERLQVAIDGPSETLKKKVGL